MISTKLCRYFIVKIYQFPCGNMAAAINGLLCLSKQENLSAQKVQFYKQAEKTHRPPPPQKPWKAEYFLSKKNSESSEPFRFKAIPFQGAEKRTFPDFCQRVFGMHINAYVSKCIRRKNQEQIHGKNDDCAAAHMCRRAKKIYSDLVCSPKLSL